MGLLQKAVETYDCHSACIGVYEEGKEVLAPISHAIKKADIEITLDSQGNFIAANSVDTNDAATIIPVTEDSLGRTSTKICAHPLSDQLAYLISCNSDKNENYLTQLKTWAQSDYSHGKLQPIIKYIENKTILTDLRKTEVIKFDVKGMPKKQDALIRWRVLGVGEPEACWQDKSLFDAFIGYYNQINMNSSSKGFCMITGKENQVKAKNHPKGIVSKYGNAKLISSNDSRGFTYRGRFFQPEDAAEISYIASQKAHNALRWLIANQHVNDYCGRTFLCWNPEGYKIRNSFNLLEDFEIPIVKPTDYQDRLKKTLYGERNQIPENASVVIAAFDATSDKGGRLSVTYYNELIYSDFMQRLYDWDRIACWYNGKFGVQNPNLYSIVNCAYGTLQGDKLKTDDRVMKQQVQRLLACRIERAQLPTDILKAIVQRASRLLIYDKSLREKILFTACAMIRKYHFDKYKEEWEMALEPEKPDRSYQFGRLLAVYEKMERDTYGKEEGREPNAIKLQEIYCQRPYQTAFNLDKQIKNAYLLRLNPGSRIYYQNLIGEIMEQIDKSSEKTNAPLKETYLMGYYLQRKALYTKNVKEVEVEE